MLTAVEPKFPNGLDAAMSEAGVSGSDLARLIGESRQNVSRWRKGERELLPPIAELIAPHLNTTAAALLLLRSVRRFHVKLGGKIGAGGAIDTSTEQSEPGIEYEIETMIEVQDAVIAYQVIGDSMLPVFEPDTVIICRAHTQDIASHIGKRVAVGTVEHGRQLKIVQPGSRPDLFDLFSINQAFPTMRDVKVEWVARIAAIIPADEWQVLERRAQVQQQLAKPSRRAVKPSSATG